MKQLSVAKFHKALKINSYLDKNAPWPDVSDRSRMAPILKIQLAFALESEDDIDEEYMEECDRVYETIQIFEFYKTGGSGYFRTMLVPLDLLGMSCVEYYPERIEIWRHWTMNGELKIASVVNWRDPQLLAKVLIAATEDICADWSIA